VRRNIKNVVFLFCIAVFSVSSLCAQTIRYDITKGEYKRTDQERIYIVGKVINIAQELQQRPGGADSQDSLFSKGRQGLMTSGRSIWTFVDNIKGQDLQWNTRYLGKFIKIHGWVFHDAQYVEIDEFSMDGVDYRWSDKTNSFAPIE
jgi:hypothetical protein